MTHWVFVYSSTCFIDSYIQTHIQSIFLTDLHFLDVLSWKCGPPYILSHGIAEVWEILRGGSHGNQQKTWKIFLPLRGIEPRIFQSWVFCLASWAITLYNMKKILMDYFAFRLDQLLINGKLTKSSFYRSTLAYRLTQHHYFKVAN